MLLCSKNVGDIMYQAHVKVDFQENCEYNASSGEAYIDIPSKEITCTLEVSQSPIRIGDTCNIIFTAKIDDIVHIKITSNTPDDCYNNQ